MSKEEAKVEEINKIKELRSAEVPKEGIATDNKYFLKWNISDI